MYGHSHLTGQTVVYMGQLGPQNGQFLFQIRILDVQVSAAATQGLRQGPGPVGGQNHKGNGFGGNGANLWNGDLQIGEDFQKEGLEFLVSLIDLVDQQHHGLIRTDGLQQGALQQVFVGKEGFGQLILVLLCHVDLNGQ